MLSVKFGVTFGFKINENEAILNENKVLVLVTLVEILIIEIHVYKCVQSV